MKFILQTTSSGELWMACHLCLSEVKGKGCFLACLSLQNLQNVL